MYPGIVLADETFKGKLKEACRLRVDAGINLLEKSLIDVLILSGGVRKRPGYKKFIGNYESTAKIMEEYALNKNVSKEKIILENLSEDTVGQFIFLRYGIFEQKKINSGIIITHENHSPKIFEITKKVLGKNYNFDYFLISSKNKKENIKSFKKTFKGVNFNSKEEVLETLFTKHPFYNHSPIFYRQELNKMITKNLL